MNEALHRGLVVDILKLLHGRGFLSANDGNVSVRLGKDRLLVTPTGVYKGFIAPDDLLVTDLDGRVLDGKGQPTGELPMHLVAMRLRPDIAAVVHAHPPTCIALSLAQGGTMGDYLPEVLLAVGEVPIVPYARPVSAAMGEALHGYIEHHDALILERHGTLTVGQTALDAYALTERLEHAATVLWKARTFGLLKRLPASEVRALKEIHARSRAKAAGLAR